MFRTSVVLLVVIASRTLCQATARDTVGQRWEYDSMLGRYAAEVVATGLRVPFGLAFLPDGRAVVSDRPSGQLSVLDVRSGKLTPIAGAPTVFDSLDAGMLDVAVHPDFARNNLIYYAFTEASDSGRTTIVERAELRCRPDGCASAPCHPDSCAATGGSAFHLTTRQRLFAAYPASGGVNHFGSRLLLKDGYLFITLGERDIRELAQELWTDHGKIVRLFDDGRVPRDNPFVGRPGARPEIWTSGHRNPHGLAVNPQTGDLWETEHGPLGGDEVNVIRRGANYGWPVITYGREYEGHPIGDGRTEFPRMEQPLHHYSSSTALSGMTFYTGAAFPQWRGNLFVGAMTPRYLGRLIVEPGRPVREERLLLEKRWRVRVVQQGPDGFIYLGVERSTRDATDGMIVRLRPAAR